MIGYQHLEQASEELLTECKVSGLALISGVKKRALRRYDRIGLLHPEMDSDSGHHVYTRQDLIQLERLAMMQMLELSRAEIKECLSKEERALREELTLQREILLEKRRRLNRVIYFMEYAEEVNRDPYSADWHHLGKVIEAIKMLRDPGGFKRFYIRGSLEKDTSEM